MERGPLDGIGSSTIDEELSPTSAVHRGRNSLVKTRLGATVPFGRLTYSTSRSIVSCQSFSSIAPIGLSFVRGVCHSFMASFHCSLTTLLLKPEFCAYCMNASRPCCGL